jgi:HSF-type DNA-binding
MNQDRTSYVSEEEVSLTSSTLCSPQFPVRLHDMLDQAERQGYQHIVSWLPEGDGFQIHEPESMLPILQHVGFNQRVWKSFLRQLQNYGFCREVKGPDKGKCTHALFIRGRRDLSLAMRRIKRTGSGESFASSKKLRSHGEDLVELTVASGNSSFTSLNSSFSSLGLSFPSALSLGRASIGSHSNLSSFGMDSYSKQVSSNRNATFEMVQTTSDNPLYHMQLPKNRADPAGNTSRKLLGPNSTDSQKLIWEIQNELATLKSDSSMVQKPTIPYHQARPTGLFSEQYALPVYARYKPDLDDCFASPTDEMCVDASAEFMSRIFLNEPTLEEMYDPK